VKNSEDRHPVFLSGDGWILHEDGAAFEMSVRPSFNPRNVFDSLAEASQQASDKILSLFPEYCEPFLYFIPAVGFEIERWKNEGPDFIMSTEFGCDRDFDAYNSAEPSQRIDASNHPFRYGGGHLHISGDPTLGENPIKAVYCAAMTAGLAAVLYSDTPELEKLRTGLYGKPGKFRVQEYKPNPKLGSDYRVGLEYRTISNTWVKDWKVANEIFSMFELGIGTLFPSDLGDRLISEISVDVGNAIVNCNQVLAKELLNYVKSKV
jgi:hypothetical protein